MNTYTCPHCKTEVTTREHICNATRNIHGEMYGTLTVYQPNYPKRNQQATTPGYMKRFGSRSDRVRFGSRAWFEKVKEIPF